MKLFLAKTAFTVVGCSMLCYGWSGESGMGLFFILMAFHMTGD